MSAPLKSIEGTGDPAQSMAKAMSEIGRSARAAARTLALAAPAQKDRALERMAVAVRAQKAQILAANAEDLGEARGGPWRFCVGPSAAGRRSRPGTRDSG